MNIRSLSFEDISKFVSKQEIKDDINRFIYLVDECYEYLVELDEIKKENKDPLDLS
jgi:predicted ATPase